MFRLLVSGSREWDQPEIIQMVIVQHWFENDDLVVVHGDCPRGADRIARDFCEAKGIPQEKYPADWDRYGKAAGRIRNGVMVDTKPDMGVFFIRGESRGTRGCLRLTKKAGIPYVAYGDE